MIPSLVFLLLIGSSFGEEETKPFDQANPLILRHFRQCRINVNLYVDDRWSSTRSDEYWDAWFTLTLLKSHPLSCEEIKKEFCAYLREIEANGYYCDSSWRTSDESVSGPKTAKKPGVWAHGFGEHLFCRTLGKGPNLRLYGNVLLPEAFGYLESYMDRLSEAYPEHTMPDIPEMKPPYASRKRSGLREDERAMVGLCVFLGLIAIFGALVAIDKIKSAR